MRHTIYWRDWSSDVCSSDLSAGCVRRQEGRVIMSKIIESVQAHYETLEVPFGRIYHWHQAHVTLKCDCGEILTFSGSSAIVTCWRCGAKYGALVHDIHYREEHLGD